MKNVKNEDENYSGVPGMIDLPKIGQEYTWQEILEFAKSHRLGDIVDILECYPPPAKPFRSDGCSGGCPEKWKGVSITRRCIVHDIRYWCGIKGDDKARLEADIHLMRAVAHDTGDCDFARLVFSGVTVGGGEDLPFAWRWSFGRK